MDPDNPYTPLAEAYLGTMRRIFAGEAQSGLKSSQTAEEVAEVLKDLIEADQPQFLCMTSDYVEKLTAIKLKDTTGETTANMTLERCYGKDWRSLV